MTGTSPNPGKRLMVSEKLFLINPAITKLCPSLSCTVVSARRTVNDGSTEVTPPTVVKGEPVCDNSDTSDTIFKLIRVPSSTIGVNLTPIPNSFSCSVMVGLPEEPSCETGMKILPPDKKLAAWPLMAIMLGSAKIRTKPSSFWPSMLSAALPIRSACSNPPPLLKKLDSSE